MMTRFPFPAAFCFLALSSVSQAITSYTADFSGSAGSLTGLFKEVADGAVTSAGMTWGATAGVGGGGGVLVTNSAADNFFYRPDPVDNATSAFNFSALTAGQGFSSSADFLWSASNTTSDLTDLTSLNMGFSTARPSNALSAAPGSSSFISGSLIRNGATTVQLRIRNDNATPFTTTFNQSALTAGNWYRLTYQATLNGDGTIANLVTLYAIGADGLATPVEVDSVSGDVTNAGLLASTESYSSYDIRNANSNGIDAIDNLNVTFIPEPSALALVALGGVALAGRRRRF